MPTEKQIEALQDAHSDLCMFNAIVSMLESGSMGFESHADQFAIIKKAKSAMQRSLIRYDKARAALEAAEKVKER